MRQELFAPYDCDERAQMIGNLILGGAALPPPGEGVYISCRSTVENKMGCNGTSKWGIGACSLLSHTPQVSGIVRNVNPFALSNCGELSHPPKKRCCRRKRVITGSRVSWYRYL